MKLLEGVRVLDMTNVLVGPFATSLLALSGAEVVKIENPDGGDLARKLGNVPELNAELMGTSFLAQNANKKSLTLNLKHEEAREIFVRLVQKADVLKIENPKAGDLARVLGNVPAYNKKLMGTSFLPRMPTRSRSPST